MAMFNNNNTANNIFRTNNATTNNPFHNTNTNPNPNPNTNNTPNMFTNNAQQQQTRNLFNQTANNQPTFNAGNNANMFTNNMGGNTGGPVFNAGGSPPGNNLFNNNAGTPPGNNLFNNQGQGQGQGQGQPMFNAGNAGNNMFTGNNAGGGNNMFTNNNNAGGNMFTPGGNTGNNMFNRGNMNMGNMGNPVVGNPMNNQNMNQMTPMMAQYPNDPVGFQASLDNTKNQLDQCLRMIQSRNLQSIQLDSWNTYRDKPLNKLPLRDDVLNIIYNFEELNKILKTLKENNSNIEKKMNDFSKDTTAKLTLYKRCLLQTVSHNKLINELNTELIMMNKEMQEYFKPMYNNVYKTDPGKKKMSFPEPREFDLKISYDVLNKLEILNQRVDDMIACETGSDQEFENTVTVLEQLIQYYQNVSCSLKEFSNRYERLRRPAIEKERESYEKVMSKVRSKVEDNLKAEFQYYDLIKEIDGLLNEKEKREKKKREENQYKVYGSGLGRLY